MSKAVLISIQPYWVFLIIAKAMGWKVDKEKTIEVRKNLPKDANWDKIVKIYCSKYRKSFSRIPKEYQPLMERFLGKVIGEFVCDKIDKYPRRLTTFPETSSGSYVQKDEVAKTCLSMCDLNDYFMGSTAYFWHISDLVIYDKPKPLDEFFHACDKQKGTDCSVCIDRRENKCKAVTRPTQSWCYVEELP